MRNGTSSQLTTRAEFKRLHQIVDVDGAAERAGAGGRPRPPMLLDADMVEGEPDIGEKDERDKDEQRPGDPVRGAARQPGGQRRDRRPGVVGVSLGETEFARRVAEA